MAPLDTLRTRLQAGGGKFGVNARQALWITVKGEGGLALYKGLSLPLMAQALYKAVLFSSFGASSRSLVRYESRHPVSFSLV